MENTNNCIPPSLIQRNEHGLICNGINYIFNPDGSINWRKMIKPEFLVPNKQVFEKKKKPLPQNIEGLDDRELLILLGGIKELAQIRGFTEVNYTAISPDPSYVVSVCSIKWIPNYETEGRSVVFSAIGDAHPQNTNGLGRNYLGPISENRSFVRCVRNFLKINIVSQEEIGGNIESTTEDVSSNLLKDIMIQNSIPFEKIKAKLIEEKFDGAEELSSVDDIPKFKQFELIERVKKSLLKKSTV